MFDPQDFLFEDIRRKLDNNESAPVLKGLFQLLGLVKVQLTWLTSCARKIEF